jgi:D-alanine-D-alanine ligase-like ATP-grasp enzyme
VDAVTLPGELLDEVRQLSTLFQREICGIDYMYDTLQHRYVFLEINTTPQLTNGAFAAEKMNRLSQAINDRLDKR